VYITMLFQNKCFYPFFILCFSQQWRWSVWRY